MITIEQVIERIPEWQGKALAVSPLVGGLTNRNYKVEVDGAPYVVRIPGASTELLAVDRINELHNTRAAARAGVGADVLHHLPDWNVMVLSFLPGETMSSARLNEPGMPVHIARALSQLHAAPRFLHDFDMFRTLAIYRETMQKRDMPAPEGFDALLPEVERIREALVPVATVPCHNDLLAENYLFDGQRLRIVDYEYSGNNDPCFELGNTCQEQQYGEEQIQELCAAYFGEAYSDKLARMKLHMVMSDVGWSLWAAISARISTLDFDFWGWAVERKERAAAKVFGPDFAGWLRDASRQWSNSTHL